MADFMLFSKRGTKLPNEKKTPWVTEFPSTKESFLLSGFLRSKVTMLIIDYNTFLQM
jgi:hypothetical protein